MSSATRSAPWVILSLGIHGAVLVWIWRSYPPVPLPLPPGPVKLVQLTPLPKAHPTPPVTPSAPPVTPSAPPVTPSTPPVTPSASATPEPDLTYNPTDTSPIEATARTAAWLSAAQAATGQGGLAWTIKRDIPAPYPLLACPLGGKVILGVAVDPQGHLVDSSSFGPQIIQSSGYDILNQAALAAVRHYEFSATGAYQLFLVAFDFVAPSSCSSSSPAPTSSPSAVPSPVATPTLNGQNHGNSSPPSSQPPPSF